MGEAKTAFCDSISDCLCDWNLRQRTKILEHNFLYQLQVISDTLKEGWIIWVFRMMDAIST